MVLDSKTRKKFNNALNTFYLLLYGIKHIVKDPFIINGKLTMVLDSNTRKKEGI